MLTVGRPPTTQDIVDLLLDCHERIRGSVVLIRQLGETCDVPPAQVAEAAERLRRYFRIALPLHARDEEESVLPRLRGLDVSLDEQLDVMCDEHDAHEPAIAALLKTCDELVADPTRHEALRDTLRGLAAQLEQHFVAHLDREEWVIFPAIRTRVDPATRDTMVRELRARRAAA